MLRFKFPCLLDTAANFNLFPCTLNCYYYWCPMLCCGVLWDFPLERGCSQKSEHKESCDNGAWPEGGRAHSTTRSNLMQLNRSRSCGGFIIQCSVLLSCGVTKPEGAPLGSNSQRYNIRSKTRKTLLKTNSSCNWYRQRNGFQTGFVYVKMFMNSKTYRLNKHKDSSGQSVKCELLFWGLGDDMSCAE